MPKKKNTASFEKGRKATDADRRRERKRDRARGRFVEAKKAAKMHGNTIRKRRCAWDPGGGREKRGRDARMRARARTTHSRGYNEREYTCERACPRKRQQMRSASAAVLLQVVLNHPFPRFFFPSPSSSPPRRPLPPPRPLALIRAGRTSAGVRGRTKEIAVRRLHLSRVVCLR